MNDLGIKFCKNCLYPEHEHANENKCLFAPTAFEAIQTRDLNQGLVVTIKKRIADARGRLAQEQERIERLGIELSKLENLLVRRACNHQYPDGSSAWEGGFMFSECKICGENDL